MLNSDVEVTKNWLTPIIKQFKNNPNLAAAQPKILDYNNRSYFEYAGAAGGYIDKYGYPYCRGRLFNTIEKDEGQYDKDAVIFWASGACLFVRKNIFWEAGGFDADYFAHQEEIDLCWRINALGYEIKCIGLSKVYHMGGATIPYYNAKKTFLNFRNSLFNCVKNLPSNQLFTIILTRLFLDGVAAMVFLFTFKIKHFFAILLSHVSFYYKLPIMLKKRSNKNYIHTYLTKSIVFNYYIKKSKKYNA